MKERPHYQTKIVETGPAEPTPAELAKKQADLLQRLKSITPDQLAEFRGRSIDEDRAAEIKISWQKTVWAK